MKNTHTKTHEIQKTNRKHMHLKEDEDKSTQHEEHRWYVDFVQKSNREYLQWLLLDDSHY